MPTTRRLGRSNYTRRKVGSRRRVYSRRLGEGTLIIKDGIRPLLKTTIALAGGIFKSTSKYDNESNDNSNEEDNGAAAGGAGAAPPRRGPAAMSTTIPLDESLVEWLKSISAQTYVNEILKAYKSPSVLRSNPRNFYLLSIACEFGIKTLDMRKVLNSIKDKRQCKFIYKDQPEYAYPNIYSQRCYMCGVPFNSYPKISRSSLTGKYVVQQGKYDTPQCDHILPVTMSSFLFGTYRGPTIGRSNPAHPAHATFIEILKQFVNRYICRQCNIRKSNGCGVMVDDDTGEYITNYAVLDAIFWKIIGQKIIRNPRGIQNYSQIYRYYLQKAIDKDADTAGMDIPDWVDYRRDTVGGDVFDPIAENLTLRTKMGTPVNGFVFGKVMLEEKQHPGNFPKVMRKSILENIEELKKKDPRLTPGHDALYTILSCEYLPKGGSEKALQVLERGPLRNITNIAASLVKGRQMVNVGDAGLGGRGLGGGRKGGQRGGTAQPVTLSNVTFASFLRLIDEEDEEGLLRLKEEAEAAVAAAGGVVFDGGEMFPIFADLARRINAAYASEGENEEGVKEEVDTVDEEIDETTPFRTNTSAVNTNELRRPLKLHFPSLNEGRHSGTTSTDTGSMLSNNEIAAAGYDPAEVRRYAAAMNRSSVGPAFSSLIRVGGRGGRRTLRKRRRS